MQQSLKFAPFLVGFLLLLAPMLSSASLTNSGGPLTDDVPPFLATVTGQSVSFEQNLGQWDSEVLFGTAGASTSVLIARQRFVVSQCHGSPDILGPTPSNLTCAAYAVRFFGSNPSPVVVATGKSSQLTHYLKGPDPSGWVRDAPHFSAVALQDVYPGIDVEFYGTAAGHMKYDIVVGPGADPSLISLEFEGADDIRVAADGALALSVGAQGFRQDAPWTYQRGAGIDVVSSRYGLAGDRGNFILGDYDPSRPLVIDPLVYGTYVGTGTTFSTAIGADPLGNARVAMIVEESNALLKLGPFTAVEDIAVVRLDAAGAVASTTIIGGTGRDRVFGLNVDQQGNSYITGGTESLDFPTVGATATLPLKHPVESYVAYRTDLEPEGPDPLMQDVVAAPVDAVTDATDGDQELHYVNLTVRDEEDAYVMKLDPSASAPLYSTVLGFPYDDLGFSIDLRPAGGAVVAGATSDWRCTLIELDATGALVITKALLDEWIWCQWGSHVALDSLGRIYYSGSEVVLLDSHNQEDLVYAWSDRNVGHPPIHVDSFDRLLAINGEELVVWGNRIPTYWGDFPETLATIPLTSDAWDFAVDAAGDVYVLSEGAYEGTFGAAQALPGGGSDLHIARYTPTLAEGPWSYHYYDLVYATALGGPGHEWASDVAVDSSRNVHVTGYTDASGFPTTLGAAQATHDGSSYGTVVAKVAPLPFRLAIVSKSHPDPSQWSGSMSFEASVTPSRPDAVVGYSHGIGLNGCPAALTYSAGTTLEATLEVPNAFGEHVFCVKARGPAGNEGALTTYRFRTDASLDTDQDGLPDAWEHRYGTQPQVKDADADPDTDQLTNVEEFNVGTHPRDSDTDEDFLPDGWEVATGLDPLTALPLEQDSDLDGLNDVLEFRFRLVPLCVPAGMNCLDHEGSPIDGTSGDGWNDGPEVHYWNDFTNDGLSVLAVGHLLEDPDSRMDTDGDLLRNLEDHDSDGDALEDGVEVTVGAYPEFADSDCDVLADACTSSLESDSYWDRTRVGNPGKGDLLDDGAEFAYWNSVSPGAWVTDYDGDGISGNLLDPDSDGDTLLDGEEVTQWNTKPYLLDSDLDGLDDGDEVRAYRTDPADWDTDGDGMPDGWEAQHNLNPLANDAALDSDADALANLGEYTYARPGGWNEATQGPWTGGTNPSDMDTEGDALNDGEEVLTHSTDPHHWDTDLDGMADFFETTYGFDPLNAGDAGNDPDADSFDQGSDGSIQLVWPSLEEYRYGRTAWDEVSLGPWRAGTDPLNPDSDGDGAGDGQEAYFGTDARVPADVLADEDADGLTWADEANLGTNPSDPDSDGDGLCDGSRGSNCRFPGMGSTGNMPGEQDYGSIAWEIDSDADGRTDSQEALKWDPGASGSAQDVDGDLLNGVIDSDSDNDGLTDGDEFSRTTDQSLPDTDGDRLKDGDEVAYYATNPKLLDTDVDGLFDGDEVETHHTQPTIWDSDGDGLGDGAEVNTHGTDPLLADTDQDTLPDHWEVTQGTQARVADADQDPDADGLSNAREYVLGAKPMAADTDTDGLPDGYEDQYGLGVTFASASGDPDGDAYGNLNEFNAKTHPLVADTDGDGRNDGWEALTAGTDPLDPDTDKDGLNDGHEYDAWSANSYTWATDHDGDTLNGLRDVDSDNDGLNDREELIVKNPTKPHVKDSDGDGLSDFDEVVGFGGRFDPNDPDTDDDGQNDAVEASLLDPNGDTDADGLKNGEETTYGTNPTRRDTDCDGAWDRAELTYWGGNWNAGGNRLLIADVDGDTIKDGVEFGTTGTGQAFYNTDPADADTDGDGLNDDEEATNNIDTQCSTNQSTSAMTASPSPLLVPSQSGSLLTGLTKTAEGFYVGHDSEGWYVQGGYGVRLYVNASLASTATIQQVVGALGLQQQSSQTGAPAAGTNGQLTDPNLPDTDGDGLSDGQERSGSQNPYGNQPTNPNSCDSDNDGLGDGLELGINAYGLAPLATTDSACRQRDRQSITRTNPNSLDTDGDSIPDGTRGNALGEDANNNGLADFLDLSQYCIPSAESSPTDLDTDDDGIADLLEANEGTKRTCFDTDWDGLSDGLELGITDLEKTVDTALGFVTLEGRSIPRFQPSASGALLNPLDADLDGDGLLDGLEDLDFDGVFGMAEWNDELGQPEMDPMKPDTDGDGLNDGRELLIWGLDAITHPLEHFLQNGGMAELKFDGSNPWETDPLDSNTDSEEGYQDNILDGQDLNPRADAYIALALPGFRMTTPPDGQHGESNTEYSDWVMEMYFPSVVVDLPLVNGDYIIKGNSNTVASFYAKNLQQMPEAAIDLLADESKLDTTVTVGNLAWRLGKIADKGIVKFNIPDDIGSLNPGDRTVKVTIDMNEHDPWYNSDDDVDLNSAQGASTATYAFTLDNDLAGSLTTGLEGDNQYLNLMREGVSEHKGKKHGKTDINEEGFLQMHGGDIIPKHFLDGIGKIPLLGSCTGQATCVGP
jgi:hypothetical protein